MNLRKVYLVNFATKEFYQSQKKLNNSALRFGVDKVISYKRLDIIESNFYRENKEILDQKRGAGFWLWKPYIILELMEKINDGDIIIYADSGIEIIDNIRLLIEPCIANNGILLFNNDVHLNKTWTKRDCFIQMGCDKEKYWEGPQILASFSVWQKNQKSAALLKEWFIFCKNKNILTDMPNIGGKNFSEFKDHRHDQSILSILAVKHKIILHRDPTQWGNRFKKEKYRKKGEFVYKGEYSENIFDNSDYPTLLNHHRNIKTPLGKRLVDYLLNTGKKIKLLTA